MFPEERREKIGRLSDFFFAPKALSSSGKYHSTGAHVIFSLLSVRFWANSPKNVRILSVTTFVSVSKSIVKSSFEIAVIFF